jgi:2-polyprenyl-3-methyl-5-hydroxy-6-metoxy-1,4-benzoquinol methylase
LRRTSQHLLWSTVADCIERQATELSEAARIKDPRGSLLLDPDLELPWYQWDVDIHAMPGGYRGEYGDNDVSVGALYDRGVYLYAMGQMGALNDDYGRSIIDNYLFAEHPTFSPKEILDMGCTVGHATLPYTQAFPAAEVHAIDLGAPVLRYGHARAEALGAKVHFSQQNCEDTSFPDEKFDLIVSHIVLHELPPEALRRTFAECHRLLKPGGLMIHADFPGYEGVDHLSQSMIDWDTYNNHEPFWGPMRDMDLVAESARTGFTSANVTSVVVSTGRILQSGKNQQSGQLWLLVGQKI